MGQVAKDMLSPSACLLPRLLSQSGAGVPDLMVPSCLLRIQPSISPHRERVTRVLPPACCSYHGRLSCFPSDSRPQGQRLLLFPGGGVLRLNPHLTLGSAVTDVCNHASLSGRGDARAKSISLHAVSSTILRRLAQSSSSSSPKANCDFPTNAILSQRRCPG